MLSVAELFALVPEPFTLDELKAYCQARMSFLGKTSLIIGKSELPPPILNRYTTDLTTLLAEHRPITWEIIIGHDSHFKINSAMLGAAAHVLDYYNDCEYSYEETGNPTHWKETVLKGNGCFTAFPWYVEDPDDPWSKEVFEMDNRPVKPRSPFAPGPQGAARRVHQPQFPKAETMFSSSPFVYTDDAPGVTSVTRPDYPPDSEPAQPSSSKKAVPQCHVCQPIAGVTHTHSFVPCPTGPAANTRHAKKGKKKQRGY
jgi:hypothetical protein